MFCSVWDLHLLFARAQIEGLKKVCIDKIIAGMDTRDAAGYMHLAHSYHISDLEAHCVKLASSPSNLCGPGRLLFQPSLRFIATCKVARAPAMPEPGIDMKRAFGESVLLVMDIAQCLDNLCSAVTLCALCRKKIAESDGFLNLLRSEPEAAQKFITSTAQGMDSICRKPLKRKR